jgi:hypothetical protein
MLRRDFALVWTGNLCARGGCITGRKGNSFHFSHGTFLSFRGLDTALLSRPFPEYRLTVRASASNQFLTGFLNFHLINVFQRLVVPTFFSRRF